MLRSTTQPTIQELISGVIAQEGKLFGDARLLEAWKADNLPDLGLPSLYRNIYRQGSLAQTIRDAAGIAPGQIAGNVPGTTVGLTNAGALSSQANLTLANEAAVVAQAASGSGTVAAPYIIENKNFTGTTGTQLNFSETDGSYYVTVRNCQFGGAPTALILTRLAQGRLVIENCNFQNTTTVANALRIDRGGMIVRNCTFKGMAVTNLLSVTAGAGGNLVIQFNNNKMDRTVNDWTGTGRMLFVNNHDGANTSIEIKNNDCTWVSSTLQPLGFVYGGNLDIASLIVENNKWVQGTHFLSQFAAGTNPLDIWSNVSIKNNDITDVSQEAIELVNCNNFEVHYNWVKHLTAGSGFRCIVGIGDASNANVYVRNGSYKHNRVNKATGTKAAGNEAIENFYPENVEISWNWVEQCPEDAFEFVNIISGSTIAFNVADNCGGQVVDCFKQWDKAAWAVEDVFADMIKTNTYVHHIYGDCTDMGVVVDGVRGGVIHDVYVDNSASAGAGDYAVEIRDRDTSESGDWFVAGPLPKDAEVKAGQIDVAATGGNIEYAYITETSNLITG